MCDMTGSLLAIPGQRISRSASRDSFATDISVNSFTSEISQMGAAIDGGGDRGDDADTDVDTELAQCREDMLQKMLQLNTKTTSQTAGIMKKEAQCSKQQSCSQKTVRIKPSNPAGNSRPIGSLFKSFSESDLLIHLMQLPPPPNRIMKHCISQAWIPVPNVQVLQCRRRHMQEMRRFSAHETQEALFESREIFGGTDRANQQDMTTPTSDKCTRTSSDEQLYKGKSQARNRPYLRKFKLSKEIGEKIKQDLARKIAKHKDKAPPSQWDIDCESGRPLSSQDRNFMIFHWLQSLDDAFET